MFARYTIFKINVKFNVSSKRWPLFVFFLTLCEIISFIEG